MTSKLQFKFIQALQAVTCACSAVGLASLAPVPAVAQNSASGTFVIDNNVTYNGTNGEQFSTDFGLANDYPEQSLAVCLNEFLVSAAPVNSGGDLVVDTGEVTEMANVRVYGRAYNSLSTEVALPAEICTNTNSNLLDQPLLYEGEVDLEKNNTLRLAGSLVYQEAFTTYRLSNPKDTSSTNAQPIINVEFLNLTEGYNDSLGIQTNTICVNDEVVSEYGSGNRSFYVPTGTNFVTMVSSQSGECAGSDAFTKAVSNFYEVSVDSAEQVVNTIQVKPTVYVGETTQNNVDAFLQTTDTPISPAPLPNNGDFNNDGVIDLDQSDKVQYAFLAEEGRINGLVAMAINCQECILEDFGYTNGMELPENFLPNSLVRFVITGSEAEVELFYYTDETEVVPLKVYPDTGEISSIPGVRVENLTIDGRSVVKVVYTVTDGGELDIDGEVNGTIVDPVGLSQANLEGGPKDSLNRVNVEGGAENQETAVDTTTQNQTNKAVAAGGELTRTGGYSNPTVSYWLAFGLTFGVYLLKRSQVNR